MSTAASTFAGSTLSGRFHVLSKLGEGGMGVVYRAHDQNLDMDVVIKVPHRAMLMDAEFAPRFAREIRSLVRLSHPHIMTILDVGEHEGLPFAVLQYLAGGTLEDRRARGRDGKVLPAPVEQLGYWLPDIAAALDFVHAQGYVHRDVKPANILFDEHGHAFLSDFGVAKVVRSQEDSSRTGKLTRTGMVLGTPDYMAPELSLQSTWDGRVDQYALAVLAFELLTGRCPYAGPTPMAVLMAHSTERTPVLSELDARIPPHVSAAVNQALAKKPEDRFASCAAFAQAVVGGTPRPSAAPPVRGQNPGVAKDTDRLAASNETSRTELGRVPCPGCNAALPIKEAHRGKRVRCPKCQLVLLVTEELLATRVDMSVPTAQLTMMGGAVAAEPKPVTDPGNGSAVTPNSPAQPAKPPGSTTGPASGVNAETSAAVRPKKKATLKLVIGLAIAIVGPLVLLIVGVGTRTDTIVHRSSSQSSPIASDSTTTREGSDPTSNSNGAVNRGSLDPSNEAGNSPGGPPETPKPAMPASAKPAKPGGTPEGGDQAGGRAGEVRTFNDQLDLKMVWCPAGTFTMGSPASEPDRNNDEEQHEVTLTQGFWLGQTEVTQAQWRAVMGTTPWRGREYVREGNDYAAGYISYDAATAFCGKLTDQERRAGRLPAGAEYRLPTEAEWEYACRAGTKTRFSFGDDESRLGEYAWWGGIFGDGNAKEEQYAHRVGQKKANPWGLFDIHGNTSEWCSDWFDEEYYGRSDREDPQGGQNGKLRVLRGGSWSNNPVGGRSANRDGGTPDIRFNFVSGFRLARTVCDNEDQRAGRNPVLHEDGLAELFTASAVELLMPTAPPPLGAVPPEPAKSSSREAPSPVQRPSVPSTGGSQFETEMEVAKFLRQSPSEFREHVRRLDYTVIALGLEPADLEGLIDEISITLLALQKHEGVDDEFREKYSRSLAKSKAELQRNRVLGPETSAASVAEQLIDGEITEAVAMTKDDPSIAINELKLVKERLDRATVPDEFRASRSERIEKHLAQAFRRKLVVDFQRMLTDSVAVEGRAKALENAKAQRLVIRDGHLKKSDPDLLAELLRLIDQHIQRLESGRDAPSTQAERER